MRKNVFKKRIMLLFLVAVLVIGAFAACSNTTESTQQEVTTADTSVSKNAVTAAETEVSSLVNIPKYIFLFIGDGMSYPQIQSASYYLGATQSNGGVEQVDLSFMDFPVTGSAQTYDSTSFSPDSASTATSIATGHKTYSGTINMDTTFTTSYETIAEKLKKQMDYKIGIISSVNINHATPAAFYAHQESRKNYYEIGQELIGSNFEYFAGGAFILPTGANNDLTDLTKLAEQSGYTVLTTYEESAKFTAENGNVILIAENLDSSGAMNYSLDAENGEWSLADYVKKGIEVLDNDTGFFMMTEGGKIDWSGHANDAAANINDTIALSDAVAVAKKFYLNHPDETLIIVTGDHETGGMSIGFAGTNYDTFLTNLVGQTITYEDFGTKYVAGYKENNTSFKDVLKEVKTMFGLMTAGDPDATEDSTLVLTDYEYGLLEQAYNRTLEVGTAVQSDMTQEEYLLYGNYDPLTVTITHVLNNKSGIGFTSYSHTGQPVAVFALGIGADLFEGYYDNTAIYNNMSEITGVK